MQTVFLIVLYFNQISLYGLMLMSNLMCLRIKRLFNYSNHISKSQALFYIMNNAVKKTTNSNFYNNKKKLIRHQDIYEGELVKLVRKVIGVFTFLYTNENINNEHKATVKSAIASYSTEYTKFHTQNIQFNLCQTFFYNSNI